MSYSTVLRWRFAIVPRLYYAKTLCRSGEQLFHLVHGAVPATLVAIAGVVVEELLVGERQQCAVAVRLEQYRHQRFTFGHRFPGPGEDQLLVRHDLAIDTADIVLLAARRAHHPAITAAGARIAFGVRRLDLAAAHPKLHFFRVGPRREGLGRRRVEAAFDGEARLCGGLGGHGVSFCDSDSSSSKNSSSKNAARRSSRSDQNF